MQITLHHISSGAAEALKPGQDPVFYESITTLAYTAGISRSQNRVFGTYPFKLRPYHCSKALANLDNLSGGKLQIVVGLGAKPTTVANGEFELLGINRKKRKYHRGRESKCSKGNLDQAHHSYHGKYVNFDNAVIYPKPIRKPTTSIDLWWMDTYGFGQSGKGV